jgi:hypothetical protein
VSLAPYDAALGGRPAKQPVDDTDRPRAVNRVVESAFAEHLIATDVRHVANGAPWRT